MIGAVISSTTPDSVTVLEGKTSVEKRAILERFLHKEENTSGLSRP
jgi:hypothetical protein